MSFGRTKISQRPHGSDCVLGHCVIFPSRRNLPRKEEECCSLQYRFCTMTSIIRKETEGKLTYMSDNTHGDIMCHRAGRNLTFNSS